MNTEINKNKEMNNNKEINNKEINNDEEKEKYKKLVKEKNDKIKKKLLEIVLRQTSYTENEALNKLETNNYNLNKVIQEYMNPNNNNKKEDTNINIQKQIYSEIRNLMDYGPRKQRYLEKLQNLNNNKCSN